MKNCRQWSSERVCPGSYSSIMIWVMTKLHIFWRLWSEFKMFGTNYRNEMKKEEFSGAGAKCYT